MFTCGNNAEASVLRARLEEAGIRSVVQGENHRSLLGPLGAYVELAVLVPEEAADQAREIIDAAESEVGRLSVEGLDDGTGSLTDPESESTSEDLELPPERDEPRWVRPRLVAFPVVLAFMITFGSGHAYARRFKTCVALAVLEVFALAGVLSGSSIAAGFLFGLLGYDAVGGALAVRASNRRDATREDSGHPRHAAP